MEPSKKSANPLLHRLYPVSLQIESLPPTSTYICFLATLADTTCSRYSSHLTWTPAMLLFHLHASILVATSPKPFSILHSGVFPQNMFIGSCHPNFHPSSPFFPRLLPVTQHHVCPPPQPHFSPVCTRPTKAPTVPLCRSSTGGPFISFTPTSLILVFFTLLITTFPATYLPLVSSFFGPQLR